MIEAHIISNHEKGIEEAKEQIMHILETTFEDNKEGLMHAYTTIAIIEYEMRKFMEERGINPEGMVKI